MTVAGRVGLDGSQSARLFVYTAEFGLSAGYRRLGAKLKFAFVSSDIRETSHFAACKP
jgi:hypothetical protein